jgi:large subunit ribosomal protein L22
VKHLRVSPNKVRQVLTLIRGLSADDAIRVLQLCQKDAAGDIMKLVDSAIANAEHNAHLPIDELYVARAYADEGPTRKWGQPRARGRYFRVRHRSSHVTIVLARYSDDELEARRRREEASGARGGGRAAQRRRAERVRRSRAAQRAEHDHDHEHEAEAESEEATEAAATTETETSESEVADAIAPRVGSAADEEAGDVDEQDAEAEEEEDK